MEPLQSHELIVDLFAGGGGASQGIYQATGRHPDIAINHDPVAVAVHKRNHPGTLHYCESIWKVRPEDACGTRPVGLLWASPDCRHFSRAAGGRPKWKSVRSVPGVVLTWATRVRPRVIVVENVREMLGCGPLLADGTPCPRRVGLSFKTWAGRLRGLGYRVEWRELCAADFGAPTIRTRLVIVAARDGVPVRWPVATHSRAPSLLERPWRTAAECIDWSLPARSIFDRPRPLKEATLRRIAEGVMRYVVKAERPFIVPATLIQIGWGERAGQAPRVPGVDKLLGTVVAGGCKHALVTAHLAPLTHSGRNRGSSLESPVPTLTCANRGEHALVAAFVAQHNGGAIGRAADEPLSTLVHRGTQQQLVETVLSEADRAGAERVAAFLIHYYGSGGQHGSLSSPLGAITTKERFALVTVHGVPTPIVDIRMRMLAPHELARAQGFPAEYDLTYGARFNKTDQIRLIGNSVCPDMAEAVVRAQFSAAPAAAQPDVMAA